MNILEFKNVSKGYKENGKITYVLKNASFTISHTGLLGIIGKSGSGKTTLLNMISLVDTPTSGTIKFFGKSLNKYSDKGKHIYRNRYIGNIFQSYHLLEKETVLFNVVLPILIYGSSRKKALKKAYDLLEQVGIDKILWNQKCMNLSGGEKQRVAIARALVNDPEIILADEPTGALDSDNSIRIMNLLRKVALKRLVIVVSHNEPLLRKYSERMISLKDGEIVRDETLLPKLDIPILHKKKKRSLVIDKWTGRITKTNFSRRKKRNILTVTSLSFSICFTLLIFGFKYSSSASIQEAASKKIDYRCQTIFKEINKETSASGIKIVQTVRPALGEIERIKDTMQDYVIECNVEALINQNISISFNNANFENSISLKPIYSWSPDYANRDLLIEGTIPSFDEQNFDIVINSKAKEVLANNLGLSPLNFTIHVKCKYEYHYYTNDDFNPVIIDTFIFDKELLIKGVVDELDYLQTPRIYYSYSNLLNITKENLLPNLSSFLNRDISWYSLIEQSKGNDDITSYSFYMFAKNDCSTSKIKEDIGLLQEPYKIQNEAVMVEESVSALLEAASLGLNIFLIICLLGTVLIISIVSFSSFTEDKKTSAILKSFGADDSSIISIYLQENAIVGAISIIIGVISSTLGQCLFNLIIKHQWKFNKMIQIPFSSFFGYRFLLPLLIVLLTFTFILISSIIPYSMSKKISIKKELASE